MIAPEGRIILIPLLIILVAGFGIQQVISFSWLYRLNWVFVILFVFCLYFFRIPVRNFSGDDRQFLSPADGKIVAIKPIQDPDLGNVVQISVFLSVFNVHKQWVPLSGTVLGKKVNKGKFLAAFNHKASMDNEQTWTIFIDQFNNRFKIKQIAGLIARRIINYMKEGSKVKRSDQLGFIRFGSRVDILVPPKFHLEVRMGDKVKGGETVLGYFQ